MTAWAFIRRGLAHYRGSYLGVLIGAALGSMVLLGAMFAGDSVKKTLQVIADQRIGQVGSVLVGGESFVTQELAERLDAAPVLQLQAQADAGQASAGQVDLLGVDDRFWNLAPGEMEPLGLAERDFAINAALARQLNVDAGDSLVLRFREPGLLSHDAPLSGTSDELVSLRGTVSRIVSDDEMGRFSLKTSQIPSPTIFLPIDRLADAIGRPGKANLLLSTDPIDPAKLKASMSLADYGLKWEAIPLAKAVELRSEAVFLAPTISSKARKILPEARPVLTYLANTIAANGNENPYSMIAGIDSSPVLPADLDDKEVVLNSWIAEDLGARPGDEVTFSYYVLGNNNRLDQKSATFTVRSIVPLEGLAADQKWMPDFPGIAEAEDNADWTPGMPLDLTRIREKDETYWDDHKGTPKAFITHRAAAGLWQNRWGSSTGLRVESGAESRTPDILESLTPLDAGLSIRDVRSEAMASANSPVDIASLFLSMSFFLIIAAVGLTAMLFRFNVEQRNHESGLLTALGISAKRILRWRLIEGFVMVVLGSALGLILAIAYTRGLLLFLETIWSTGGGRLFRFHMNPASMIGGLAGFVILVMLTIWLVTRRQASRGAGIRLESGTEEVIRSRKTRALPVALVSVLIGGGALAASKAMGPQGAFFLAGFAFLIAGLAVFLWRLRSQQLLPEEAVNPPGLAALNTGRRPTRSLVVTAALATGIFLVVSVAAFQKHGGDEWKDKASGAGGFAFWIETTSPVHRGSDTEGLELQAEAPDELLPFRIGQGDDASCFNLNAVARPRLLATDVSKLTGRFPIKNTLEGLPAEWAALQGDGPLRAFVDETTLLWVLKMKLGDRITYTDDTGAEFPVEIVGTLAGSVFQGSLIVDEESYLNRFPDSGGYRLFLGQTRGDLELDRRSYQQAFTDLGANITTTSERLAAFHSVENTYIAIFHVLGGLGVVLGAAGLGLLTARNLAERREEFDTLRTLGIPPEILRSVILRESVRYIIWGLGVGLAAAIISILPNLPDSGRLLTFSWIGALVILIAANALFWAWLGYQRSARSLSGASSSASA